MPCPHCGGEVSAAAIVPDEQQMTVTLTSESELFDIEGVADVMKATGKTMRAIADAMEQKVAVFVKSVIVEPNKVAITVLVVECAKKKTRKVKVHRSGTP